MLTIRARSVVRAAVPALRVELAERPFGIAYP
jgi:hypothetical protein